MKTTLKSLGVATAVGLFALPAAAEEVAIGVPS